MRAGWFEDAKRVSLAAVAAEVGIRAGRRGLDRCPACDAGDGVRVHAGGARWHCHHCQADGDAVDLVSLVVAGARVGSQTMPLVRDWYAERGWCEAEAGRVVQRVAPRPAVERQVEQVASEPPPAAEVAALLRGCRPVDEDSACSAWLRRRGLRDAAPRRVAAGRLALALREGVGAPWAWYGRWGWSEIGYRLIVPMFAADGSVVSVRARSVAATPRQGSPKALPPAGYSVRGCVMASPVARRMLSGAAWPADVVVVEGEPQWLAACLQWPERAVVGVVAGSWTPEIAERVPRGASVVLVTDHGDRQGNGDRYAERIADTLHGRRVSRLEVVCG